MVGWYGAEEEAASGKARPSLCAGDAGVDVLGGDALLGAATHLNDGVFVEVLHTACILHESVHRDIRPKPLGEPRDDRDGKEEVGVRAAQALPALVLPRCGELLAGKSAYDQEEAGDGKCGQEGLEWWGGRRGGGPRRPWQCGCEAVAV